MRKSIFAITAAAFSVVTLSSANAQNAPYPFGDPPYRLNWEYSPQIEQGCWKWNWQQYQYNDHCPVWVSPKAYMYPRTRPVVLRTKG